MSPAPRWRVQLCPNCQASHDVAVYVSGHIIRLYDDFTHSRMGRRAFLKRLAALAWSRTLEFLAKELA